MGKLLQASLATSYELASHWPLLVGRECDKAFWCAVRAVRYCTGNARKGKGRVLVTARGAEEL